MRETNAVAPKLPKGFRCAGKSIGLKDSGKDLAVIVSDVPAAAAAVFTRNRFPGAPIVVGRKHVADGRLQAIVANSKISNVATGEKGVADAFEMCRLVATELRIRPDDVLVSSTGVIGTRLPMQKIRRGLHNIAAELGDDPLAAAEAIMTTDTHPKCVVRTIGPATLTGIAKGAGMIAPNMATMLCYLLTDARLAAPTLRKLLPRAVDDTLNMLSVDSDTSTSDTAAILANGLAGPVPLKAFARALEDALLELTRMLARDGEGATKLLDVHVTQARNKDEARRLAKAVVDSPLVKTMVHGADPNVGRIIMALGKCAEIPLDPQKVIVRIGSRVVFRNGMRTRFDEATVRQILSQDTVHISCAVGRGRAQATAYGCDLSHGYVDENAAYYSS